jgi:hypothetical protein
VILLRNGFIYLLTIGAVQVPYLLYKGPSFVMGQFIVGSSGTPVEFLRVVVMTDRNAGHVGRRQTLPVTDRNHLSVGFKSFTLWELLRDSNPKPSLFLQLQMNSFKWSCLHPYPKVADHICAEEPSVYFILVSNPSPYGNCYGIQTQSPQYSCS